LGYLKLFETTWQALDVNLSNLLDSFGLRKKIIAFVKDEGANLNVMTLTLRFVVSYDISRVGREFQWKLFWTCYFQGMPTWDYRNESLQRHEICEES
jgi:hypothetical protein